MDKAIALVLRTAFRHPIREPSAEAGFARLRALTGSTLDNAALAQAVAQCTSARLIEDPVCLPEGALQCHWRLALTPAGVQAARSIG